MTNQILNFFLGLLFLCAQFLLLPHAVSAMHADTPEPGCANRVVVRPLYSPAMACVGDTAEMTIVFSLAREGTSASLTCSLGALPAGVSLVGNPFNQQGELPMVLNAGNPIYTLPLFFSISATVPTDTLLSVAINVVFSDGACLEADGSFLSLAFSPANCDNSVCPCTPADGYATVINIGGNNSLQQLIAIGTLPATQLSDACLSVDGVLKIDQNFNIRNCRVKLGTNAEIRVEGDHSFWIEDSHVHGCDYLWKWIKISDNGKFTAKNNIIEDGLNGIMGSNFSGGQPKFAILNNLFRKNYVGFTRDPVQSGLGLISEAFTGNEFTCQDAVLLPCSNCMVTTGQKSFAGVDLSYQPTTFTIGDELSSDPPNYFHHLQNGIFADGATLEVEKTRFSNIPEKQTEYLWRGNGIFGGGMSLTQKGFGNGSAFTPSFVDVDKGIYAKGPFELRINQNYMQGMNMGVMVEQLPTLYPPIAINSNTIECSGFGINLVNAANYGTLNILNNYISVDKYPPNTTFDKYDGFGIYFSNADPEGNIGGAIAGNYINLSSTNHGIYLNKVSSIRLYDNHITFQNEAQQGFYAGGCDRLFFNCNSVSGTGVLPANNPRHIGFDFNNTIGSTFKCNTAEHTLTGFRFAGFCNSYFGQPTDFAGNVMRHHWRGLWMKEDAVLFNSSASAMEHRGNQWLEDYDDERAIHLGSNQQIALSKFKVHNDLLPYYPQPSAPNAPFAQWFEVDDEGSVFQCQINECVGFEPPASQNLPDELGLHTAGNTLEFHPYFQAGMERMLRRQLFTSLTQNPALLQQNQLYSTFYYAMTGTPIDKLLQVEAALRDVYQIDSSTQANLESRWLAIDQKRQQIQQLKSNLSVSPTQNELEQYREARRNISRQIDSIHALQLQAWPAIRAAQLATLADVSDLNSNVTTGSTWETQEKMLNSLYLTKIAVGNYALTLEEKSLLETVAGQCPTLGGPMVFFARSILAILDDFASYDDDAACEPTQERDTKVGKTRSSFPEINKCFVYPVPAKDKIEVRFARQVEQHCVLELTNSQGQMVNTQKFFSNSPEGHIELPVEQLANGLYALGIRFSDQVVCREKIVIQH